MLNFILLIANLNIAQIDRSIFKPPHQLNLKIESSKIEKTAFVSMRIPRHAAPVVVFPLPGKTRHTKAVFSIFELSIFKFNCCSGLKIDRSICAIFKLAINSIKFSMRISRHAGLVVVFPQLSIFKFNCCGGLKIDRSICAIFKLAINSIKLSMRISRHAGLVVVFPLPFYHSDTSKRNRFCHSKVIFRAYLCKNDKLF